MNSYFSIQLRKDHVTQLFRYGLVGLVSNGVGYLAYLLLTHFGATPKITMSLLYFTGASVGFFGNRTLTFSHNGNALDSGLRYLLAHITGYLINLSILLIFVDRLGYSHQHVQAIAIFVVASFLFLAFKFYVFRRT